LGCVLHERNALSEKNNGEPSGYHLQERLMRPFQLSSTNSRISFATRMEASQALQTHELSDISVFSLDRRGLLAFTREKVYFDQSADGLDLKPHAVEWSLRVDQLIERAQTAEAQKRASEALMSYRQIIAAEPRLNDWAKLCIARIRYQSGDGAAKSELVDPTLSGSDGLTPGGLPAALIACVYAEQLEVGARADFIPLIDQTLDSLRRGRWWLSFDERRFYDDELRRLLESAGRPTTDDARLDELANISRIVRMSPPSRRDTATRSFERDENLGILLVWLPVEPKPGPVDGQRGRAAPTGESD
jgi:hypothetical protein